MQGICTGVRHRAGGALIVWIALAAGCTRFATVEEVPDPEPVPAVRAVPAAEPTGPARDTTPAVQMPEPSAPPPVAIVLTGDQAAYSDVAVELAKHFDDHAVYDLGAESLPPISVLRSINDSDATVIVAIGLKAAQSSVSFSNLPVVFAQVFNHQEYELLNDNSRGVSAFAPVGGQLAAWREIYPDRDRIGVIIGEGHEDLLAAAEVSAIEHGIEFQVRFSHSDQETLYAFRRMIHDIDGFWLFPDNRILSARALNQILVEANRLDIPVAAPIESMLKIGASFSIATVASDIADTIAQLVSRIQAGEIDRLPPMTELSEVRVTVREPATAEPAVASRNRLK